MKTLLLFFPLSRFTGRSRRFVECALYQAPRTPWLYVGYRWQNGEGWAGLKIGPFSITITIWRGIGAMYPLGFRWIA